MKRLAAPPKTLYMVARIWEPGLTIGETLGPYVRRLDAERALARVGSRYTIIESHLSWRISRGDKKRRPPEPMPTHRIAP